MGNKKCVAFLDLLGFSVYIESEANQAQQSAIRMLTSVNHIFQTRCQDSKAHPWKNYNKNLQPLAKRTDIDSFESFLPMSDSIFVIGHRPNDFMDQLSSFICSCFRYTAKAYDNPMDKTAPERIIEKQYTVASDGSISIDDVETQWYPHIFRGGVCFDEVTILQMTSLIRNETFMTAQEIKTANFINQKIGIDATPNVAGKGVVKAVKLEGQKGAGPKLYIDDHIIEELDTSHKAFVATDDFGKHYLWPAYSLIWENELGRELREQCHEFLSPAINLWKAYKGGRNESKYAQFVELIIASFVAVAKQNDKEAVCEKVLKDFLDTVNASSFIDSI